MKRDSFRIIPYKKRSMNSIAICDRSDITVNDRGFLVHVLGTFKPISYSSRGAIDTRQELEKQWGNLIREASKLNLSGNRYESL